MNYTIVIELPGLPTITLPDNSEKPTIGEARRLMVRSNAKLGTVRFSRSDTRGLHVFEYRFSAGGVTLVEIIRRARQ